MNNNPDRINRVLFSLSIAFAAGGLYWLIANSGSFLWDFKTYYAAGRAFLTGLDPYSLRDLSLVSSQTILFPYVYPPHTLVAAGLLAVPPYSVAVILFLMMKILALGTLLLIWRRHFLHDLATPLFVLFSFFAFNAALVRDFETGNISVFEQLGLWFAFSLLLRDRWWGFAVVLLFVGSVKLTPLLFLLLPILLGGRRRTIVTVSSAGAAVVLGAGVAVLSPRLFNGFMQNLHEPPGRGIVNPSLYQAFVDGQGFLERHAGVYLPGGLAVLLFCLSSTCILLLAGWGIRTLFRRNRPNRKLLIVLFSCVVYALLMPRFKDYSYLLLVVPAWYLLFRSDLMRAPRLTAIAVMIPFHPAVAGFGLLTTFWKFYPLILSIILFVFYLQYIHRGRFPLPDSSSPPV